jgi:hypothetical protein
MSFLEQFHKMIKHLEEQGMFINHFRIIPPDENEVINTQIELGYELDASIVNFYCECNGIELVYTYPQNPDFKRLSTKQGWNNDFTLDDLYDGVIWIHGIQETFLTEWDFDFAKYERAVLIDERRYTFNEFAKNLKPFDFINKYGFLKYDIDVAFFLDGSQNPCLVLGNDYQSNYEDSFRIYFDAYLNLLIKSKGIVDARLRVLNYSSGINYGQITKDIIFNLPEISVSEYNSKTITDWRNEVIDKMKNSK